MTAIQISHHTSMVHIVNAVFGGSDKKKDKLRDIREEYNDITEGAGSLEDAVARINKMLSF